MYLCWTRAPMGFVCPSLSLHAQRSEVRVHDDTEQVLSELKQSVERLQELLEEVLEQAALEKMTQAQEVIDSLQAEVKELQRRDVEMKDLVGCEDHIHYLQVRRWRSGRLRPSMSSESETDCNVSSRRTSPCAAPWSRGICPQSWPIRRLHLSPYEKLSWISGSKWRTCATRNWARSPKKVCHTKIINIHLLNM